MILKLKTIEDINKELVEAITAHDYRLLEFLTTQLNLNHRIIGCNIYSVAKSGMSRQLKFFTYQDTGFVNLTYLFANLLNKNLTKNDTINASGCGMDMIFDSLYNIAYRIFEDKDQQQKFSQNYFCI